MGILKKLIRKFVLSVPHLASVFENRRYGRHKPDAKISAEITFGGKTVTCEVLDISLGGLKIAISENTVSGNVASDGGRVTDARSVLLRAGDFSIAIPCVEIRGNGPVYSAIFEELAESRRSVLNHIIENFTKKPPLIGPNHILR